MAVSLCVWFVIDEVACTGILEKVKGPGDLGRKASTLFGERWVPQPNLPASSLSASYTHSDPCFHPGNLKDLQKTYSLRSHLLRILRIFMRF